MIRKLQNGVIAFSSFVLVLLVLLIVYDALMRYFFSYGVVALQELEWHLYDIVILLAISYTLKENSHVRIDIFYNLFSDKKKSVVRILSHLFFIIPFSIMVIYFSLDFVMQSYMQSETSSNPGGLGYRFIIKSLIPIAFTLLALESAVQLKDEWAKFRSLS